jgi:hypothetical protein
MSSEGYRPSPEAAEELIGEIKHLRAVNDALSDRVNRLVAALDDQFGTPCEQVRHNEEKAELLDVLQRIVDSCDYRAEVTDTMIEDARAAIAKARGELLTSQMWRKKWLR